MHVCMSHHLGKTTGPIYPKFCTRIHLGPEMVFMVYGLFCFQDGNGKGRSGEGERRWGEVRGGQGRFIKLFFKPGRSRVIQASLCNNLKNISWSAIPSKDLFGIFQSDYSNSQRIFGKNRFSGDVLTCHVHCRPSLFRKHEHNIFDFISFNYLLHHV